jgi:hypothetical protein
VNISPFIRPYLQICSYLVPNDLLIFLT